MCILVIGIVCSAAGLIKKQVLHMEKMNAPAIAYVFRKDISSGHYTEKPDESSIKADNTSESSSVITDSASGNPSGTQTETGGTSAAASDADKTGNGSGAGNSENGGNNTDTAKTGENAASNTQNTEKTFTDVDASYFTDAVFIGDSRIEDMAIYISELDKNATFYGRQSLSVYNLLDEEWIDTDSGTISIDQALQQDQFGKVYILVGINEMGYGTTEKWINSYTSVLNRVRELQPNALIFIMGNSHVSKEINGMDNITNETIDERNQALSKLADSKTVFYFDLYEGLDDSEGFLDSDITYDGMHLVASEYGRIYDICRKHGVK